MQNRKQIYWIEAVCQVCYEKFFFIEGHQQPKICWRTECINKYYLNDLEKFFKNQILCQKLS